MAYEDKDMTCRDCGKTFVWTAGEQEFYASKGFDNPPSRCPDCRKNRKQERQGERVLTTITCKKCGKQDQVPFKPYNPDDILCSECFAEERGQGGGAGKPAYKPEEKAEEKTQDKPEEKPEETPAE